MAGLVFHGFYLRWFVGKLPFISTTHSRTSPYAISYTDKKSMYQALVSSNTFVPIAEETMGTCDKEALSLVAELGIRIACESHDQRSAAFLCQRINKVL